MGTMNIHIQDPDQNLRINENQYREICNQTIKAIALDIKSCAFIFVTDAALKQMHSDYLNDPTATDVITFDLGEDAVEGEIYISTERARAQAEEYGVTPEEEVLRLMVHGLLHLKGYDDLTDGDRLVMKREENKLVEQLKGLLA